MKNKIIIKVSSVVVAMATLFLLNGNVSDKISATSVSAATEVNFMSLFKDNMVIQRDKPVKIWGTYDGNSAGVIITIKLGSEEKEAISSDNEWSVTFSPRSVSNTPQTITLKSGEITKTISICRKIKNCFGRRSNPGS